MGLFIISKYKNIFDKKERRELFFFFSLILITMLLEVFSIGLIIPVIMSILNQDITSLAPFLKPLLKFLGDTSSQKLIIFTSLMLIVAYLLKNAYLLFFLKIEGKYLSKIEKNLRTKIFRKYISHEHYNYFKSNTSKLLSNITNDLAIVVQAFRSFLMLMAEITVASGIFAFLFFVEPIMMIFNLIIILFGLFFFNLYSKRKVKVLSSSRKKNTDDLFLTLNNSFDSIKEINVFNKNLFFENIFNKSNHAIYKINKKFHVLQGLPKIFYEFMGVFLLMTLILIMTFSFKDKNMMIAFLALAGASAFRLIPSANRILVSYQYLGFAEKSLTLINNELRVITKDNIKKDQHINFQNIVEFKNVSFKYENRNNYVLKDINLKIKKNDKLLFYGETGSGKSTFIELLLGLLKPTKGSIEVDNKDVNLNFKEWSKYIGYIPQKVTLIDGSILSNIAFGVEENEININLLEDAIKLSEINSFLDRLPDGINTNVGEFGSKLSGGQIQRLGIARAVYRNPDVLILDEATNALDETTEQKVFSNILKKFKDKALIVITHNKSLLGELNKFKIENSKLISL
jgi:ABC-type multidrug transport system fused ATPase/permease subunit